MQLIVRCRGECNDLVTSIRRSCFRRFRQILAGPLLVVGGTELKDVVGRTDEVDTNFLGARNNHGRNAGTPVWPLVPRADVFVGPLAVVVEELMDVAVTAIVIDILKVQDTDARHPYPAGRRAPRERRQILVRPSAANVIELLAVFPPRV